MNFIENTVKEAIVAACQIDPSEVTSDVSLDDLGLGSMGLVAVIARMEASLDREFNPDEVVALLQASLVGELVAAVSSLIAAGVESEGAATATESLQR